MRPAAPLLFTGGFFGGSGASHDLTINYGQPFQVLYDVHNVPGANGALLEISTGGPVPFGTYNPFNNPNGTIRDNNGVDTGSVYFVPVSGTIGFATVNPVSAGLLATLNEVVRVIPTQGGQVAGEGSDVSSVSMNGVLALDGGFVNNGFGVNGNGADGFITSGQQTASGQILTSLETFTQSTNAISKDVETGTNSLFFTNGWGIYGGDLGLFGDSETISPFTTTYNTLHPTAGTVGGSWTPPSPNTLFITEGAANQANDIGAFLAFDTTGASKDNERVYTSNIPSNTFGPIYDVSAPTKGFGSPDYLGIGENTATNTGVLVAGDFNNFCGGPTIETVNLGTGTLGSFTGVGLGVPFGVGVDSTTNKAAVPTVCDNSVGIYNLATDAAVQAHLPGTGNGFYTMADQTAHQFVMTQNVPADFAVNNNAHSVVHVLDENGNLNKSLEDFFFFNSFLTINANNLQVNPSTRQGYVFGPGQQQLEPFHY